MKTFAALILCIGFLFSATSCAVFVVRDPGRYVYVQKTDNGNHKGWYKNPNNPHHQPSNSNPGMHKGKPKK
jgi:hypothetical protein